MRTSRAPKLVLSVVFKILTVSLRGTGKQESFSQNRFDI